MSYRSKSGGVSKMGGKGVAPNFKPPAKCPTPAACKRAGKCQAGKYK